jgi:hypothetical protein
MAAVGMSVGVEDGIWSNDISRHVSTPVVSASSSGCVCMIVNLGGLADTVGEWLPPFADGEMSLLCCGMVGECAG